MLPKINDFIKKLNNKPINNNVDQSRPNKYEIKEKQGKLQTLINFKAYKNSNWSNK